MLEDLPAGTEPTRIERLWQRRVIPGSKAVWATWAVIIAVYGVTGFFLWLLGVDSTFGRILAGVVLLLGLFYVVWSLWFPRGRRDVFENPKSVLDAVQQAGVVAVVAAAAFAFITDELHRAGLVELTDGGRNVTAVDPSNVFWFYVWHLTDALPASPLSTLRIDAPYGYTQHFVGVLVLTYTLLVVTPFVTLIKAFVSRRREKLVEAEAGQLNS
ncbi:MAG: hypothetical protein ABJA81_10725 [Nocardioidaceae bacterium]